MVVDPEAVLSAWSARGFRGRLWIDPPGRSSWDDRQHDVAGLLMVVEGEVEVHVQGEVTRPEPGEEIFIPAHVKHSVRNVGSTVASWLYAHAAAT